MSKSLLIVIGLLMCGCEETRRFQTAPSDGMQQPSDREHEVFTYLGLATNYGFFKYEDSFATCYLYSDKWGNQMECIKK